MNQNLNNNRISLNSIKLKMQISSTENKHVSSYFEHLIQIFHIDIYKKSLHFYIKATILTSIELFWVKILIIE